MKTFINQIRWLFSPQDKRKLVGLSLLMALSALLEMAGLGLLLGAAALFLTPQNPAAGQLQQMSAALLPGIPENGRIALTVGAIALLLAGKNLFALWIVKLQSRFIAAKQSELAQRLFDSFLDTDYETFKSRPPELSFSGISRIYQLTYTVLLPGLQIVADIMVIVVLSGCALGLFPLITGSATLFMILIAATVSWIIKKANRRIARQALEYELAENRVRHIGISGAKAVKSFHAGKFFSGKFSSLYRSYAGCFGKLYTLGQVPRLTLESAAVITAAGVFCVLLLSGMPRSQIMLTLAVLTAAVARLLPALSRCHYNVLLVRQGAPLLNELVTSLQSLPPEKIVAAATVDAGSKIVFENVSFTYRDGKKAVFEALNLEIEPQTTVAVSGVSGRGKTTLADLLTGLLKPQQGRITAGGVDIAGNIVQWRQQTGYVPQEIFLIDGTLRENVAFGIAPEAVDEVKLRRALQMAQLAEFEPDRPVSITTVSGGQRQRIGIARALYRDARLLILDEPTSALDAATEAAFGRTLEALHGKITLVVISHREATVKYCDRNICL